MKRIAYWVIQGSGFAVCSPDSERYDLYFSSEKAMFNFAGEMGWKLRRG